MIGIGSEGHTKNFCFQPFDSQMRNGPFIKVKLYIIYVYGKIIANFNRIDYNE